jgi:hypothetical protein
MGQKIVLAMVRAGPDKDWIEILFIFYLVYKRAEFFCERAREPGPFTRPRSTQHTGSQICMRHQHNLSRHSPTASTLHQCNQDEENHPLHSIHAFQISHFLPPRFTSYTTQIPVPTTLQFPLDHRFLPAMT